MKQPTNDDTRRGFLGTLAGTVSGLALSSLLPSRSAHGAQEVQEPEAKTDFRDKRRRWGMTIDLDLCTGCGACVVACRSENNVPCTGFDPADHGTGIYWMDLVLKEHTHAKDRLPEVLPTPCMHCENPTCVKVCPVGATYVNEEGIVAQIYDRCIGCRYCQEACPYSRRYFSWGKPKWPDSYRNYINPDVSTRPKGVVEKCNFCHHRIRKIREEARSDERHLTDEHFQRLPACAGACPATAITFGDLDDPDSRVSTLRKSSRAYRLLDYLGTDPKVSYLGKDRRVGL